MSPAIPEDHAIEVRRYRKARLTVSAQLEGYIGVITEKDLAAVPHCSTNYLPMFGRCRDSA